MGLDGTLCFLNNIEARGGDYTVLSFARQLVASWPNVGGRIIHPDLLVRRYLTRLIVTLVECGSDMHFTIYHEADATIMLPRRSKAQTYAQERFLIDLMLSENARSLVMMMQELDQERDLNLGMAMMGASLFLF